MQYTERSLTCRNCENGTILAMKVWPTNKNGKLDHSYCGQWFAFACSACKQNTSYSDPKNKEKQVLIRFYDDLDKHFERDFKEAFRKLDIYNEYCKKNNVKPGTIKL